MKFICERMSSVSIQWPFHFSFSIQFHEYFCCFFSHAFWWNFPDLFQMRWFYWTFINQRYSQNIFFVGINVKFIFDKAQCWIQEIFSGSDFYAFGGYHRFLRSNLEKWFKRIIEDVEETIGIRAEEIMSVK